MTLTLLLAALVAVPALQPTDQTGWFPFTVPDLAGPATAGAALDLSFLSPEPTGRHGFLRAAGEHLVDDRGTPIRLFGSNFTDYHPLMPKAFAEPVARRLQQLGINFVRFHYFDWDIAPRGILNPDRQTLNAEKLDQLDWLFYHLQQHGVWVDLNLHVARGYGDMPPGWDRMGKNLDFLYEPFIQSQMQYARELLGHVNPYTQRRYADEPGLAVIELNNENTALNGWDRWAGLPEQYSGPLRAQWNDWLRRRYGSTAKVSAAWGGGELGTTELLRNADLRAGLQDWTYQQAGGAGRVEVVTVDGQVALRWTVTAPGAAEWHHQLQQASLPLTAGQTYTLRFRARGSGPLAVDLMLQVAPWTHVGGARCGIGPKWADYAVTFEVPDLGGRPVRLNLNCNNRAGNWELRDLSLRAGAPAALEPSQRLETGTVPLVGAVARRQQARDYVAFLSEREIDYVKRMQAVVTGELGAKQIVYCTQVTYGGAAGLVREAQTAPVIDCHAYPDHPSETSEPGQRRVRNISLTGDGAAGLTTLANHRVEGKPYLVTEFDLNPPNDHTAQVFPLLALLAAYQDWAGVLDYVWYNFSVGPGTDHLSSSWATVGDTAQMAFVPAAALLYRLGLVQPAQRRLTLSVPQQAALATAAQATTGWSWVSWTAAGVGPAAGWLSGLATRLTTGDGPPTASAALPAEWGSRLVSDTGQIVFDRATRGHEVLTVNAPACRLVTGVVEGRSFGLGDVRVAFQGRLPRGFGQALLVSLDGHPLATTQRALLTIGSKAEGTGQQYTADRQFAKWGQAPMLSAPVTADVTLPGRWVVQPLDGGGRSRGSRAVDGTLQVRPADGTWWYLLTRE